MGKYLWCNIKWAEYTRMYMNMHKYRQYNHVKVKHNHVKMTENLSISTGYLWDSETMRVAVVFLFYFPVLSTLSLLLIYITFII